MNLAFISLLKFNHFSSSLNPTIKDELKENLLAHGVRIAPPIIGKQLVFETDVKELYYNLIVAILFKRAFLPIPVYYNLIVTILFKRAFLPFPFYYNLIVAILSKRAFVPISVYYNLIVAILFKTAFLPIPDYNLIVTILFKRAFLPIPAHILPLCFRSLLQECLKIRQDKVNVIFWQNFDKNFSCNTDGLRGGRGGRLC